MSKDNPDTEFTRIKFLGAKYDTLLPDLPNGRELTFTVLGVVVGHGDRVKKDGTIGLTVELDITSVTPVGFEEPVDPNAPTALPLDE